MTDETLHFLPAYGASLWTGWPDPEARVLARLEPEPLMFGEGLGPLVPYEQVEAAK